MFAPNNALVSWCGNVLLFGSSTFIGDLFTRIQIVVDGVMLDTH